MYAVTQPSPPSQFRMFVLLPKETSCSFAVTLFPLPATNLPPVSTFSQKVRLSQVFLRTPLSLCFFEKLVYLLLSLWIKWANPCEAFGPVWYLVSYLSLTFYPAICNPKDETYPAFLERWKRLNQTSLSPHSLGTHCPVAAVALALAIRTGSLW